MSPSIELPITYPQIENAFRDFYAHMRRSAHLKQFFESDAQMDQLIVRQAQNFYDSLSMDEQAFRQNYENLGQMHAEIHLPFEKMFESLTLIRNHLLKRLPAEYHQNFYRRIALMAKWLAKGYFNFQIKKTFKEIEISVNNIEKTVQKKHQYHTLRPLKWLTELLTHYKDPDFSADTVNNCPLTPIIQTLKIDEAERKEIEIAHREQHILADCFLYFYRKQKYTFLEFILSKLSATSMMLSIKMSYAVSQEIIEKLQHDPLTGLLLRHSLNDQYELIKSEAHLRGEGFGILIIDLDFFKKINDTYGHQAGDEVLKTLGKLITQQCRDHDRAFRYGGEEFILFVTQLTEETLAKIAERIRQKAEQLKIEWKGTVIPITLSIGCHWVEPDEMQKPLEKLIEKADKNLYQAKESGRNRVVCT
ncbi:diguanylate cyclase [Galenea microaerophila]